MQTCTIQSMGGAAVERMQREMAIAAENKLWVMNNIPKLRQKYADKYVASDNGKIISVADSPDGIFSDLKKKKYKNISVVAIEFVPKDIIAWLL